MSQLHIQCTIVLWALYFSLVAWFIPMSINSTYLILIRKWLVSNQTSHSKHYKRACFEDSRTRAFPRLIWLPDRDSRVMHVDNEPRVTHMFKFKLVICGLRGDLSKEGLMVCTRSCWLCNLPSRLSKDIWQVITVSLCEYRKNAL